MGWTESGGRRGQNRKRKKELILWILFTMLLFFPFKLVNYDQSQMRGDSSALLGPRNRRREQAEGRDQRDNMPRVVVMGRGVSGGGEEEEEEEGL